MGHSSATTILDTETVLSTTLDTLFIKQFCFVKSVSLVLPKEGHSRSKCYKTIINFGHLLIYPYNLWSERLVV